MENLTRSVIVHQGSIPGEMHVSDESRWYVTETVHGERGQHLGVMVVADFATKAEALAYKRQHRS